jgi:hypothetical protein
MMTGAASTLFASGMLASEAAAMRQAAIRDIYSPPVRKFISRYTQPFDKKRPPAFAGDQYPERLLGRSTKSTAFRASPQPDQMLSARCAGLQSAQLKSDVAGVALVPLLSVERGDEAVGGPGAQISPS